MCFFSDWMWPRTLGAKQELAPAADQRASFVAEEIFGARRLGRSNKLSSIASLSPTAVAEFLWHGRPARDLRRRRSGKPMSPRFIVLRSSAEDALQRELRLLLLG
jgi:hypothetical protein